MYAGSYTAGPGERSGRAYRELKERLLAGDFPLGRRMAEEALSKSLGMSRTPVREALSRLHAEGLVDRHPGGGFEPTPPDLHTARELYEVRFALELAALTRPDTQGTPHDADELATLRAEWAELAATRASEHPSEHADTPGASEVDPEFVLLDEDFHVRLAQAAGNQALAETLVRVNERIRPVRMHDFLGGDRIARTIEQHLAVLDAVIATDLGLARSLLVGHFDESLAVAEARAAEALTRMMSREARR